MRVGRFAVDEVPRIGVFREDSITDVTSEVDDFQSLLEQVTRGDEISVEGDQYDVSEVSYLPPSTSSNTVFAVALNYRSHIDETQTGEPERPLVFMKLYRSLVGHDESIQYHTSETNELDYEAELGAVIGKPAWRVDPSEALDYVAGYTIVNDTTARDIQRMQVGDAERLDWFSGKVMQGTSPIGPYLVTANDVSDPQDLQIESRLNGDVMQDESSGLMIRSVADLVSYLSRRIRLEPGDVIATGTPEGVGAFQDVQLADGDTVEIDVEDIGTLTNTVRSE